MSIPSTNNEPLVLVISSESTDLAKKAAVFLQISLWRYAQ